MLSNSWVSSLSEGAGTLKVLTDPRYKGIPVNLIPSNYSMSPIVFLTWAYKSDPISFPTPQFLRYQGWPRVPMYDQYQLSVTADCRTYELIGTHNLLNLYDGTLPGPWKAQGGVMWDADFSPRVSEGGNTMGITAAGAPLAPQVLRVSEVAAGLVEHVFHYRTNVCRGGARALGQAYVWPARGADCVSDTPDPSRPPYGAWFRLRADYPMPADPGAAAVVRALKVHGMVIEDGATPGIAAESGIPASTYEAIDSIPLAAFEAVDTSSLRANPSAGTKSADYWKIK